ncbi:MAG: hypothetical protein FWB79_05575 [Treponema sp.]|nr:hypothetical protein [Treponema sp.]
MRMDTKARGKIALLCAVVFLGIGVPAFSQDTPDLDSLTLAMDAFAGGMARALPFNASMGLNWSDAYIGKLFPSNPPHFGIGFAGGFTMMGLEPIERLLNEFDAELPDDLPFMGLPIPGMMAEIRLGGLFLPFDLGFKLGFLPAGVTALLGEALELDYFVVGGDFRYALVEAGRIVPAVSLGVGFTHLRGGIGVNVGTIPIDFPYTNPLTGASETGTLTVHDPTMGLNWSTNVLDFKVQVSRPLFIITPYIGLGASHGWSRVSYGAGMARLSVDAGGQTLDDIRQTFADVGIDILDDGFFSEVSVRGWSFRAFGGISLNLSVLRLDFTGMYNFRDGGFGTTVGFRFQL